MKKLNAKELQDLLQRRRDLLTTLNGKSAAYYERLAKQVEAKILALIGDVDALPTPEARAQLLSQLRAMLSNGTRSVLTRADADLLETVRLALTSQAAYWQGVYGADSFIQIPNKRIVRTFLAIDERIRNRTIIRTSLEPYKTGWAQRWTRRYDGIMEDVQRRFTRAALQGQTFRDVQRGLTGPLGELAVESTLDAEAFATQFTRTLQHQLHSDFSIATATEVGVEKFVNVGVTDDRQSTECYYASQEPPKTLEEWDRWISPNGKGGRPGDRHYANCRCLPAAVPPGLEDEDWSQPNDVVEGRIERASAKEVMV